LWVLRFEENEDMQRSRTRRPARAGFTLLEILIVLAIIGVIAAMVVPKLLGQQQTANIRVTRGSIKGLETTVSVYVVNHGGTYPQSIAELMAPSTTPDGLTIEALLDKEPVDAWQRPLTYVYESNTDGTSKPKIWSFGPDGQDQKGSGDDINNWTVTTAATR
jgi:general secretion pathway protein G